MQAKSASYLYLATSNNVNFRKNSRGQCRKSSKIAEGWFPLCPALQGSVVALCPYVSHQDPRLFGSGASVFDPNRPGMLFGGSTQPHRAVVGVGGLAGLSFGGGKYR